MSVETILRMAFSELKAAGVNVNNNVQEQVIRNVEASQKEHKVETKSQDSTDVKTKYTLGK